MSPSRADSVKVLIVHRDASLCEALEGLIRKAVFRPCAIFQGVSPVEAPTLSQSYDARWVWMDLDEQTGLALEMASELRRAGRIVVGLYDPLSARESRTDLLRRAVRAGVCDFLPVPCSEDEVRAVFDSRSAARDELLGESLTVGALAGGALAGGALAGGALAEGVAVELPQESTGSVICFMGAKGGVGTSTLALATAAALAERSQDVVLMDAVPRFGTVAHLAGVAPDRDVLDLVRDLDDLPTLSAYLLPALGGRLQVLAGPRDPVAAESLEPADLSRVLIQLKRRFGQVVIDVGSSLDALALAVLDLAETVYLTTEPSRVSLLAGHRLLALMTDLGWPGDRIRVVLTGSGNRDHRLSWDLCEQQLGRKVEHEVAYQKQVAQAAQQGEPPPLGNARFPFGESVRALAADILGVRELKSAPLALVQRGFR